VDWNFYRFRSGWSIDVPADVVYTALERFEDYPGWWPEIRRLRLVGEEACEVTCRSVLPYDLTFVLQPSRRDPGAGVLEASMTGDLEGFSRWTISRRPTGSHLLFEEEVQVNKRSLRMLAPIARPVFRGNHSIMMKHARTGLATHLASLGFPAGALTAGPPGTPVPFS
jgi:hypothetical protein